MRKYIDPEKFALHVLGSTPAKGDSPEAIAKEKVEQYVAAYQEATSYNENFVKPARTKATKEFYRN